MGVDGGSLSRTATNVPARAAAILADRRRISEQIERHAMLAALRSGQLEVADARDTEPNALFEKKERKKGAWQQNITT